MDDGETGPSNGGRPEYAIVEKQRGMIGIALHYLSPPLRGRRSDQDMCKGTRGRSRIGRGPIDFIRWAGQEIRQVVVMGKGSRIAVLQGAAS